MTRILLQCALLTTTFALTLPAQATTLTRTFVSSTGVDTNPCTITQPCATFGHAYTLTQANGIVAALDPGKYGPITIMGPITIDGNGWSAITGPAGGNAITITATASDRITLTGLKIDGAGAAYNGIVFNSGGRLTITNCIVQNFVPDGSSDANTGNGILIQPTSSASYFYIANTTVSNDDTGIAYIPPSGSPTINGVIDHVAATNDIVGIGISVTATTGGSATITISDSDVSNDEINGISVNSATVETRVSIDNATIASDGTGIMTLGNPNVLVGRSVITNNNIGVNNAMSPNNFYSYQDNRIDFNNTQTTGSVLLLKTVQ